MKNYIFTGGAMGLIMFLLFALFYYFGGVFALEILLVVVACIGIGCWLGVVVYILKNT